MTLAREDRNRIAAERILDAAGELFAEHGIGAVSMGDVARAAGCSRATLYRYFADRHELHVAFVHREARRVGALVAADAARVEDPEQRVVTAVLSAAAARPREPQPGRVVREPATPPPPPSWPSPHRSSRRSG